MTDQRLPLMCFHERKVGEGIQIALSFETAMSVCITIISNRKYFSPVKTVGLQQEDHYGLLVSRMVSHDIERAINHFLYTARSIARQTHQSRPRFPYDQPRERCLPFPPRAVQSYRRKIHRHFLTFRP